MKGAVMVADGEAKSEKRRGIFFLCFFGPDFCFVLNQTCVATTKKCHFFFTSIFSSKLTPLNNSHHQHIEIYI